MEEEKHGLEIDASKCAEIYQRKFEVDFFKVKTVKDVTKLLKALNMIFEITGEGIPDEFKDIYESGFLKEITDNEDRY